MCKYHFVCNIRIYHECCDDSSLLSTDSAYSDVLEFSAGAGAPSVPQPPLMVESSVHSIVLQWTPPCDNGAEITSYKLEMEDPDSVGGVT